MLLNEALNQQIQLTDFSSLKIGFWNIYKYWICAVQQHDPTQYLHFIHDFHYVPHRKNRIRSMCPLALMNGCAALEFPFNTLLLLLPRSIMSAQLW